MPLGMKVDLGPGDIVLDGNPARPQGGGGTAPPILALSWTHVYCGQMAAY